MKKYKLGLSTTFLSNIAEFDRNVVKIDTWGYTTDNTVNKMVADIKSGKGIEKPVEVVVCDGKALMVQGCHRLAAAKKAGVNKLPAVVLFLKKLTGKWLTIENKMKEI